MKLVKTTFFSGIITVVRLAAGFVAGKIVAIYTGASGIAIIGAFTNFILIVLTFANGAITTGVIKYTAEFEGEEEKLKTLFSTSFKITLFCSSIIGLIMLILSPYISEWVFAQDIYKGPIRIFGIGLLFYALNSLLIAILNGKKQIKTYTIVNSIGSIVGLFFTAILVYVYKVQGALYALVLSQSIVFFVTAGLIVKSSWFSMDYFNKRFNKSIAIKLSHYSMMAIVSALTVPVSQIILRNLLISKFGINEAGYWQGMMRVSDAYLMLITTSLSTYYLPKLASIKNDEELRIEILKGYRLIMPFVLFGCVGIYFSRILVIRILFTADFDAMEDLFFWQLTGDFFKIATWILGYLMLAKAMTKMYIILEIVFNLSYVALGYLLTDRFQLNGIVMAFALNYFFCFVFMLVIFHKIMFKNSFKMFKKAN